MDTNTANSPTVPDNASATRSVKDTNKKLIAIAATVAVLLGIIAVIVLSSRPQTATPNTQTTADQQDTAGDFPIALADNTCPSKLVFGDSAYAETAGQKYSFSEAQKLWIEQNCPSTEVSNDSQGSTATVPWSFDGQKWNPTSTPPACTDPLRLESPVNVSLATSILYPGQTRGGNYKPHGGFRFDNASENKIDVLIPMDAVVVNGGRYLAEGEIQYTFDFIAPCGIKYRLGHLRELAPKFQALADNFPAAQENDSRTTLISPPVAVKAGELLATKVGIISDDNTFVDFGVYDLRQTNAASKNASWAAAHGAEHDHYAVCWFDLLNPTDASRVKSLPPGDPTSGKTSDYCK